MAKHVAQEVHVGVVQTQHVSVEQTGCKANGRL